MTRTPCPTPPREAQPASALFTPPSPWPAAAGAKGGYYSSLACTTTYKLRCCSNHAFGCPYQLKVVVNHDLMTVTVLESSGWGHKHDGYCLFKRGLPPSLKNDINDMLKLEPRCKLQYVAPTPSPRRPQPEPPPPPPPTPPPPYPFTTPSLLNTPSPHPPPSPSVSAPGSCSTT